MVLMEEGGCAGWQGYPRGSTVSASSCSSLLGKSRTIRMEVKMHGLCLELSQWEATYVPTGMDVSWGIDAGQHKSRFSTWHKLEP